MKKILTLIKALFLLLVLFVLSVWSSRNDHTVNFDTLIHSAPKSLPMNEVMVILLAVGFILGVLTSFYVMSKLKLSMALKKRQAQKEAQKREQNQALVEQSSPPVVEDAQ